MNVYAAIGHFKGNENITCIALMQSSKKEFMTDCYGNEFVPYVVLTEKTLNKIQACTYSMDIFNQVAKMTTNYRVWKKSLTTSSSAPILSPTKLKMLRRRAEPLRQKKGRQR